jgi:hypothetical protein
MSTSPWLLGSVCVWGGKVCDANHRARDFGRWALAPHPSSAPPVCELVLLYVEQREFDVLDVWKERRNALLIVHSCKG